MKKKSILSLIIFLISIIFYIFQYFLRVMPSAISNNIMLKYHITEKGFGIMCSMFFLGMTLMQIPAGIIYDYIRIRYIITFAIGLCSISILLFGQTNNYIVASFARFMIGISSAFSFVGSIILSTRIFKKNIFLL